MKLPNELTEDKSASFAIAWSVSWRFFVVFFVIGSTYQFAPYEFRNEYPIPLTIAVFIFTFLLFWVWVHRLLRKGIGRVKIIFMETENYEKLSADLNDQSKL